MASGTLDFTDFGNVIDGIVGKTEKTRSGTNPSTGESLFHVPLSTAKDIDAAVKAARKAFPAWANLSMDDRRALLTKYAEAIKQQEDSFARLLTLEQGKPLKCAKVEAQATSNWIKEITKQDLPKIVVYDTESKYTETRYTPLGVVAGIVPWNFPLKLAIGKISPALMTGDCIIVKPSQVVSGAEDVSPMLTSHPGIDKITFTGSSASGKKVMKSASETLKRVTLELGGNDPAIILPDVNIASVAAEVATFSFLNSGQICIAIKRIYVHEDIYLPFRDTMLAYAKTLAVGDGLADDVFMGPVQNKMQYERLLKIMSDSKETGQTFALEGPSSAYSKGYFISPTIVDRPPDNSRLVVEEPFGPIFPLLSWTDEDDVIDRANDTDMGLGASVWGKDIERTRRIADKLEAGSVWINQHVALDANVAFSGHKQSGLGVENGIMGLAQYCNVQSLHIKLDAKV